MSCCLRLAFVLTVIRSKKPKSKKAPASASVGAKGKDSGGGAESASAITGSRDEDKFNEDDDRGGGEGSGSAGGTRDGELEDTSEVGQKRKRYITVVDQAGKKRKVVDIVSSHFRPLFLFVPYTRIEFVPSRRSG